MDGILTGGTPTGGIPTGGAPTGGAPTGGISTGATSTGRAITGGVGVSWLQFVKVIVYVEVRSSVITVLVVSSSVTKISPIAEQSRGIRARAAKENMGVEVTFMVRKG